MPAREQGRASATSSAVPPAADYEDEEECWEEDCSEEMNMMVCSFFPESWLWVQEVLPNTTDSSG